MKSYEVRPLWKDGKKMWGVFDGNGRQHGGALNMMERAEEKLEELLIRERLRRSTTTRTCMCCRTRFASEGIHNRLCGRCRMKFA